jgi:hypothetical protein
VRNILLIIISLKERLRVFVDMSDNDLTEVGIGSARELQHSLYPNLGDFEAAIHTIPSHEGLPLPIIKERET